MFRQNKVLKTTFDEVDKEAVNTVRFLGVDMIQKANSGHPGIVLDAAPMIYVLWNYHMNINPNDPKWINRDRFVLSAGHGSALLYSMLHLSGYDLDMEELKEFRQYKSLTPGHPEYGKTVGVDATTGPLGQGIGMAVGMAMAEKHLNATNPNRINHYTYSICGDGDLMEGVSQEAINIAGKEKLGKLVVMYDSNDVTLDGELSNESIENTGGRFKAAGWNYIRVNDGENLSEIDDALLQAKESSQPTLIEVKTTIGYGSPEQGTNKVHGSALGLEDVEATREQLGYACTPFQVKKAVYDKFRDNLQRRGMEAESLWENVNQGKNSQSNNSVLLDMGQVKPVAKVGEMIATRVANQKIIQQIARDNPHFWGGAADLSSSNKTQIEKDGRFSPEHPENRNIWFGVREFGMGVAMNGIALHSGTRVFGSTFLTFSDYLKPAIRLAALQNLPVTYIFTHDSIAIGEDGPTHEPVEQLAALRSIPNLNVFRPADANELLAAWKFIAKDVSTPSVLILTRQKVPVMEETINVDLSKGGYVVSPAKTQEFDGILIASGSEVHLAIEAQKVLREKSYDLSVVSVPSFEIFNKQSAEYKQSVLPPTVTKRISIEMASTFGWAQYSGSEGINLGIDRFGASGNGAKLQDEFGFNVDNIVTNFEKIWKER